MCFWVGMIFFQACPAKICPRLSNGLPRAAVHPRWITGRFSRIVSLRSCGPQVPNGRKTFFCRQNDEKWAHFLGSILKEILKDGGAKNVLNFDENGMLNFDENGMLNLR